MECRSACVNTPTLALESSEVEGCCLLVGTRFLPKKATWAADGGFGRDYDSQQQTGINRTLELRTDRCERGG